MPDITFKTKEEIPEELRGEAKEANGAFTVNVVAKKKVDEFRETNITVSRERDELKTKLDPLLALVGADPEKFKGELVDLRKVKQQVDDGTLKGSTAIQEAVDKRLKEATEEVDRQRREAVTQRDGAIAVGKNWETKFKGSQLDQQIANVVLAADSGANPQALADIQGHARGLFVVKDDGSLVPMRNGVAVYSAKDGASPMPPQEWLAGLIKDRPYLGKPSSGGGAGGGRDEPGETIAGMSAEAFNKLPPQDRIRLHRKAQRKS